MTRRTRVALAAIAALVVVPAPPATALPLFARAQSAPCAKCHLSPPRLNARGIRYLLSGYPAHAGAEVAVPPAPAASLVAEFGASVQRRDTLGAAGARGVQTTSEFRPYALALHGAGRLAKSVAYRAEAVLDSASGPVRLPVLFARFVNLAGGAGSVTVGRFEAGLPFLSSNRRVTLTDFRAPVSIAAEGVELAASRDHWAAATGRINSERGAEQTGAGARSFSRIEDTYVWGMRSFAGQTAGARVLFARQASNISYHAWLQRLQVVVGGSLGTDRLRFEPAWVLDRFDDRPVAGMHQRHQYAVLQGLALLDAEGVTAVAFRLEHEHVTPTPLTRGEDHDLEVLRLLRWLSPAVRLALEGSHDGDNVAGPHETRIDATVTLAY